MKKTYSLLYLITTLGTLLLTTSHTKAQDGNKPPVSRFERRVISPSPEATQLGVAGNVSPDLQTGAIQLSVPLTEAKGRQLSLPVSLNYHYTGLLVDELPSWAGLGWSLSAGGVITRTVRGLPDETNNNNKGYNNGGRAGARQLLDANGAVRVVLYPTPMQPLRDLCRDIANGKLDTEPDAYSVSVPGYSGAFFIDTLNVPFIGPYSDYRIRGDATDGWVVTAGDGTKYIFSGAGDGTITNDITVGEPVTTSWYLTAIVSADETETITLEYNTNPSGTAARLNMMERKVFEPRFANTDCNNNPHSSYQSPIYIEAQQVTSSTLGLPATLVTSYLEKITTPTTLIVFHSDLARRDVLPSNQDRVARRLRKVSVIDRFSGDTLRQFVLQHSYFGDQPTASTTARRLRLDAVQEVGKPAYRFAYLDGIFPSRLDPQQGALAKDHWGFYTGRWENTLIPTIPGEISRFYRSSGTVGVSRSAQGSAAMLGVLKQVQYPSSGWSRFEYEPNQVNQVCGSLVKAFGESSSMAGNCPSLATITVNGTKVSNSTPGPALPASTDAEARKIEAYIVNPDATPGQVNDDGASGVLNVRAVRLDAPHGGVICSASASHSIGCGSTTNCGAQGRILSGLWCINVDSTDTNNYGKIIELCRNEPGCGQAGCGMDADPYRCNRDLADYGLAAGKYHYYIASAVSSANTSAFEARITVYYAAYPGNSLLASDTTGTSPATIQYCSREVGGVRVSRTWDHASDGDTHVKTYRYVTVENNVQRSSGRLFYEPTYAYQNACSKLIVCAFDPGKAGWLENGYHMGYDQVTVETDQKKGGTTTYYYNNGRLQNNTTPSLRSLVTRIEERTETGNLVKRVSNTYQLQRVRYLKGMRLQPDYAIYGLYGTGSQTGSMGSSAIAMEAYYWAQPLWAETYWPKLVGTAEAIVGTTVSDSTRTQTTYQYLPMLPNYPTAPARTFTQLDGGRTQLTKVSFPGQYFSPSYTPTLQETGVNSLLRRGIISQPVETQTWRCAGADTSLVAATVTQFDKGRPQRIYTINSIKPIAKTSFQPSSVQNGTFKQDSRYQEQVAFTYLNSSGNLIQQQVPQAPPSSYLWGYEQSQPIAEIKNASYAQTAFTSFEPDATGRWRYDSLVTHPNPHRNAGGRTGRWGYRLDAGWGVSRENLPAGEYELLFWADGPAPVIYVNGVAATSSILQQQSVPQTVGAWKQYRYVLRLPANSQLKLDVVSAGNAVVIDEVRLHPVGAQMTSYTYDSGVGMTSQTDITGRSITYEYDGLGRLLRTRDEQGRIRTQNEYHYARP